MQEAKQNLRLQVKKLLSNLGIREKKEADSQICSSLIRFLEGRFISLDYQSLTLGVYYPLSDEVSWLSSSVAKRQLAFPQVSGSKMLFRKCGIDELNEVDQFGRKMRVPCQGKLSVDPDIIIVPGLAFDHLGNRLGRGGGYYDSYLRHFDGLKVGICKHLQLVDELPIEEHDEKVNFVVTEKALIDVSSSMEEI